MPYQMIEAYNDILPAFMEAAGFDESTVTLAVEYLKLDYYGPYEGMLVYTNTDWSMMVGFGSTESPYSAAATITVLCRTDENSIFKGIPFSIFAYAADDIDLAYWAADGFENTYYFGNTLLAVYNEDAENECSTLGISKR